MMDHKLFRLSDIAGTHGDRPALVGADFLLTYRHYFQLIDCAVEQLRSDKIGEGERVALLGTHSLEYPLLLMALWQVGAVAVPVSPRLPEQQLAGMLRRIGCRRLILLPAMGKSGLPLLAVRCSILNAGDLIAWPPGDREAAVTPTLADLPLSQDASIIFTSGSSGEAKAALHTFGNHFFSALGSNENIPFQPGDRWLLSLPLYHVGGLAILWRALVSGGTVAVSPPDQPLARSLETLKITHLSLVATQLFRLLKEDSGRRVLCGLKAILLGGSTIPPALIRQAVQLKLAIHTSYGSTEMASQITTTPPGVPEAQLLTSGKLLRYRRLRIAEDGEILVKGATLFHGYLEDGLVLPHRDAGGWFATGDTGKMDPGGWLQVTGRKDNLFISGGENIQPEEIERHLQRLPGILEALVVPVAHQEFGMRPAAFIRTRPRRPHNIPAIRSALEARMPRFKIPDVFFPWPETDQESGIKPKRRYFQQLAEKKLRERSVPE